MKKFYSNGKLLLTGEYVVLDGALALAVPTKFGQSLDIGTIDDPKIIWESLDENGNVWFEDTFELGKDAMLKQVQHDETSKRLFQILNAAKLLNPEFLNPNNGFKVTTQLDFPRNWGLGTSSTLINNIAQWAGVDAFKLLEMTFGGSGYDVACAQNNQPITYKLQNGKPSVKKVDFNPPFKEHLYFVHLNKKQNSRDGIAHYKAKKGHITLEISEINEITSKMVSCKHLKDFDELISAHESIISKITNQIPVKKLMFHDFDGHVKSLGAWGGDFILATSNTDPTSYFKEKGFHTVIPFDVMVL